jgi:hypothetical protein
MGSIVQFGDVPAWIGASTGAASLYLGLRDRQQAQALDFARTLQELVDLTPLGLRQVVEDNPVIAQMVDPSLGGGGPDRQRQEAAVAGQGSCGSPPRGHGC